MSPILVRPVREQLEHDRVIRQLQRDLSRRKIEVGINPGAEQNVSLGTLRKEYPDAILFSTEKGRKVIGVVEVETGESVNHLEALAQWAHFARLRVPFHLYVPAGMVDVARRLCEDNQIHVSEIWSFHSIGDQVRFTLVHRGRETAPVVARKRVVAPAVASRRAKPAARTAKPAPRGTRKVAKKPARAQKRR